MSCVILENWVKEKDNSFQCRLPDSMEKDSYFYEDGMFIENSKVYDLMKYRYIEFEIECKQPNTYSIRADTVKFRDGKSEAVESYTACAGIEVTGVSVLQIPVELFNYKASESCNMKFTRAISIEGTHPFTIRKALLKSGKIISCEADVYGLAGDTDDNVQYTLHIENCTMQSQCVSFQRKLYGNEDISQVELPKQMVLKPLEHRTVCVRVRVTESMVAGGYEQQEIMVSAGGEVEKVTLFTSKTMRHPYLLLTQEDIDRIRQNIRTCSWAEDTYCKCVEIEKAWKVPSISDETRYLFWTSDGHHARKCAILYRLGAGEEYRIKAVQFLKELSNPSRGYLHNKRACNQELVHEGEFFKSMAFAYDLVWDSEEFTIEDRKNLTAVFRTFAEHIDVIAKSGNMSNWQLAEIEGALYCAGVLQDMALMQRFLYGIGGMTDMLSRCVCSDGWWFEASIGYNLLAVGIFSEIAHVMLHFGMDLRYMNIPASYSEKIDSRTILQDGLSAENWGSNDKNYRNIQMMWDSLVEFYDYRGVIFGLNDSAEMHVQGTTAQLMDSRYDLAYALYGKKEYADLLMLCKDEDRDLLFGKPDVAEKAKDQDLLFEAPDVAERVKNKDRCGSEAITKVDAASAVRGTKSVYADSAGVCVLRSQKKGVSQREQIQAVLKYGSHGGAHGHYDRGSMTGLMRCGRSLTGPENVWYSYHTMMYKFYVQTSINHNLVAVDLKLQEAVRPKRLLFYGGEMMQAAAVQNYGRWSNPPYGGWQVNGDRTLKERSWNEGRYVPTPDPEPEYAVRTEFTEPVLTRRLMIVTDDFVMNIDYAKADQVHEYECIYHLHGLQSVVDADGQTLVKTRHTEQLDESILSSGQFITDCDWYDGISACALDFSLEYTEDRNNGHKWLTSNRTGFNEPGRMHTKLYLANSEESTLVVGCDPEYQGVNKQLRYRVRADEKELAAGHFGAWILGRDTIDVDISGRKELVLETNVTQVEFEENHYVPMEKTIFWGNPQIQLRDHTWVNLSDLIYRTENIDQGYGIGTDYAGSAVKIQAKEYTHAIPAEPEDLQSDGKIVISLEAMDAVRFRSDIGGDYPVGDESEKRRMAALCSTGKEAVFVSVLETTEKEYEVRSVELMSEEIVLVHMKDGRQIRVETDGIKSEHGKLSVHISERKDGVVIREEKTAASDQ